MLPISKISTSTCALALGGLFLIGGLGRAGAQQQSGPTRAEEGRVLAQVRSAAAQPNAPQGAVSRSPLYMYGPGASGYGYYSYPGPQTAPARASGPSLSLNTPARRSSSSSTYRDWSTGRNSMRLAKPWLRPMD
jgi:hypothetical protein